MINWKHHVVLPNSVCDHTQDEANQTPTMWSSAFVDLTYDNRLNWTPLSPIPIINIIVFIAFRSKNACL